MKLTRFNKVVIYVDCIVNFRGKDVHIKWTDEDGYIDGNFDSVFGELEAYAYDQAHDEFLNELPIFNLISKGFENE